MVIMRLLVPSCDQPQFSLDIYQQKALDGLEWDIRWIYAFFITYQYHSSGHSNKWGQILIIIASFRRLSAFI